MQSGTKENDVCSNRGLCDMAAGECHCFPEYRTSDGLNNAGARGDCGYAAEPVTACPGTHGDRDDRILCSGHGVCAEAPTYRCACNVGWMGGDCSERECAVPRGGAAATAPKTNFPPCGGGHAETCPYGFAWFDYPYADNAAHAPAECSNRGTCDRVSGICDCQVGFEGAACDRSTRARGAHSWPRGLYSARLARGRRAAPPSLLLLLIRCARGACAQ